MKKIILFILILILASMYYYRMPIFQYSILKGWDQCVIAFLELGLMPDKETSNSLWHSAINGHNMKLCTALKNKRIDINFWEIDNYSYVMEPNLYAKELEFIFENDLIEIGNSEESLGPFWFEEMLLAVDEKNEKLINAMLKHVSFRGRTPLTLITPNFYLIYQKPYLLDYMYKLGFVNSESQKEINEGLHYSAADNDEIKALIVKIDKLVKQYEELNTRSVK